MLQNTHILIKNATIDIMSCVTIWGVVTNTSTTILFRERKYPIQKYINIIAIGFSIYLIGKYF